jgi:predicted nucleic acid-binding protein
VKPEYLLDTNVVSETAKPQPNGKVVTWLRTQGPLLLPAIGVYELVRGIERTSGRKRLFLDGWLAALLGGNARVVPFDEAAAVTAAGMERESRRQGRPLPERDLFILATARAHGLRLATRNTPDFRGHSVPLYDPFSDQYVT